MLRYVCQSSNIAVFTVCSKCILNKKHKSFIEVLKWPRFEILMIRAYLYTGSIHIWCQIVLGLFLTYLLTSIMFGLTIFDELARLYFSLNAQSEIQILKDSNLLMLCMIVRIEISLSTFNIHAKKIMNTGSLRNGTFVLSKFVLVKLWLIQIPSLPLYGFETMCLRNLC